MQIRFEVKFNFKCLHTSVLSKQPAPPHEDVRHCICYHHLLLTNRQRYSFLPKIQRYSHKASQRIHMNATFSLICTESEFCNQVIRALHINETTETQVHEQQNFLTIRFVPYHCQELAILNMAVMTCFWLLQLNLALAVPKSIVFEIGSYYCEEIVARHEFRLLKEGDSFCNVLLMTIVQMLTLNVIISLVTIQFTFQ